MEGGAELSDERERTLRRWLDNFHAWCRNEIDGAVREDSARWQLDGRPFVDALCSCARTSDRAPGASCIVRFWNANTHAALIGVNTILSISHLSPRVSAARLVLHTTANSMVRVQESSAQEKKCAPLSDPGNDAAELLEALHDACFPFECPIFGVVVRCDVSTLGGASGSGGIDAGERARISLFVAHESGTLVLLCYDYPALLAIPSQLPTKGRPIRAQRVVITSFDDTYGIVNATRGERTCFDLEIDPSVERRFATVAEHEDLRLNALSAGRQLYVAGTNGRSLRSCAQRSSRVLVVHTSTSAIWFEDEHGVVLHACHTLDQTPGVGSVGYAQYGCRFEESTSSRVTSSFELKNFSFVGPRAEAQRMLAQLRACNNSTMSR
jgi:hypothetical protein